ncbi:hypothetical protein TWF730_003114 [Orbilia blumenaviensis]|uniref:F-box domain-containing protein n=1 Tax=Orbilia blumenaviensis TaxID=1796055 RepID=A0AAV9U7V7_9PEZI
MTYKRSIITERTKDSVHCPRVIAQPAVQCPRPLRSSTSGPALKPNYLKRPSLVSLTGIRRQSYDRSTRTIPTVIQAEKFPIRVRLRILELLNFTDLQSLLSVSWDFYTAYISSPDIIAEKVGRNSFRYDREFGKYFPIDYPGCWFERKNKDSLPFTPWKRHLYHLGMLLDIERDLFKVSHWIHWGNSSISDPHEKPKKGIDQQTNSCPLSRENNYQCGRTYSVLIDFAQKGLYGPTGTTSALPNPCDERSVLTAPVHGALREKASMSSLGLISPKTTSINPKYDAEFRSTAGTIEMIFMNKLWNTHTRPIQLPCCWKDRHPGMTLRQRPRRFVQIAPFWLMLQLFECQGMIRCLKCDPKAGKWWNHAYAFYWDLATYWAINAPGSVDFFMK